MVIRNIKVPTGNICIYKGENGLLEFLSIGDYGKENNIKADFMGLSREINGVCSSDIMPLEDKWVITISTQYGCSMGCSFCDVPKVGPGRNATLKDLQKQILSGIQLHPEVKTSKRLNIHFARMGEPSWNPAVLDCGKWIKEHIDPEYKCHPVISTMMPRRNEWLKTFIHSWMRIKNRVFFGEAGLQLSINSTDKYERDLMFSGNASSLHEISEIMRGIIPTGRKITLNFALAGYRIDGEELIKYFSPDDYICKITPMHMTKSCVDNKLETLNGYNKYYPYVDVENHLKSYGYDVIVFIPSKDEDDSLITCGNAILSGNNPRCNHTEVQCERSF